MTLVAQAAARYSDFGRTSKVNYFTGRSLFKADGVRDHELLQALHYLILQRLFMNGLFSEGAKKPTSIK